MKGRLTLKKLSVVFAICLAVLCLPGYSEPTPEQIKERTEMLVQAINNNDVERTKLCIKLGADVNAICDFWHSSYNGWITGPMLASAVSRQSTDIVELLIKSGADVNAKCGNDDDSLLRIAAMDNFYGIGNKDIADLLIKAGADVNAKNKYGRTALRAAAIDGNKDIVELLIKASADVNSKASDGWTALRGVASENGNKDIAELLIKAGADVNAKDNDGYTVLMCALRKYCWEDGGGNYKDVAELLIKAGADADATLKWAVIDRPNSSAVQLLIELGANVNATDNDGLTLLTHAILHGRNDIADLLRTAGAKE